MPGFGGLGLASPPGSPSSCLPYRMACARDVQVAVVMSSRALT